MTDKQIIIDGVYVYECVNAKRSIFGIDVECRLGGDCSQNPNCYYKQLKRKEQECDMWKNLTVDNGAVALKYQQQLDQLKAENDELKRLIAKQKNAKIQLSKLKDKQYKEFCDMKQTLTEIKEIAENAFCLTNATNKDMAQFAKQVLQKISECEGKQ